MLALHHGGRWSYQCSQDPSGVIKDQSFSLQSFSCDVIIERAAAKKKKMVPLPLSALCFGGMLEDATSWCNSFKQPGSPKTYANPAELEGVQLLCFLWIYRGCGEDPESQPAVLWRFQPPKHFLKTCPEITTASLGYSITTLFCQCLPTYLHFFFFFTLLTYLQLPNLYVNVLLPKQCNTHVCALAAGNQNSRINGPSLRMDGSHVNRLQLSAVNVALWKHLMALLSIHFQPVTKNIRLHNFWETKCRW